MAPKFWTIVTVIISAVFIVLAFPVFRQSGGTAAGILYTLLGLAVIWAVFFARSWIFTRPEFQDGKPKKEG